MPFGGEDFAEIVLQFVITLSMLTQNIFSERIIPAIIIVHPDPEITFVLHTSVKMPCQASGHPDPSYYWTRDGHKLDTNMTTRYVLNNGDLLIHEATKRDEGVYYCWAWNRGGTDRSSSATLILAFLDPFPSKEPDSRHIELGSSAVLKCKPPPSYPKPEVMWYKKDGSDNMRPIVMGDIIIQDLEGNLHFVTFQRHHGGVYICICFNRILRNQVHDHNIELYPEGDEDSLVQHHVSLVWSSTSPVTEVAGSMVKIQCIFGAYPRPFVNWERVEANLPDGRNEIINQGTTLLIENVQVEDSGTYECIAFNEYSVQPVKKEIRMAVEAKPQLITKPVSVNITGTEHVSFECSASGQPIPNLTWYINWADTDYSLSHMYTTNNKRTATAVYSTLQIAKNTPKSSVVISCVAGNRHGNKQSSAYLSSTETNPVIGSDSVIVTPVNEFILLTVLLCTLCIGSSKYNIVPF